MKASYAKTCLPVGKASVALMIVFALAPSIVAAQSVTQPTTASLLSQLNALEQELSAIEATIASLLGTSTSTLSMSSTTLPALSISNVLAGQTQSPCSALASYVGVATDQTCSSALTASQQTIVPQSFADPVAALLGALTAPIPSVTTVVAASSSSLSTTIAPMSENTSTTPSYQSLIATSCGMAGETVAVSGGYSCIGICMPIPSSTLECKSGMWQLQ